MKDDFDETSKFARYGAIEIPPSTFRFIGGSPFELKRLRFVIDRNMPTRLIRDDLREIYFKKRIDLDISTPHGDWMLWKLIFKIFIIVLLYRVI